MPGFEFSHVSDVGLIRSNNEDTVLFNEQLGLWLVADGMGGHAAGEVASDIASHTIEQALNVGTDIASAINTAHVAILTAASSGEGKHGMGSTVVALHCIADHYQVAWVGDSRAYLWGNYGYADYQLTRLTTDHSYVQMLYQSGIISEDELATHPEKNIITQCLGSNELEQVNVDITAGQWHENDWIILCSDGLTDTVSDQIICDILYHSANTKTAVNSLLQESLKNGGKDNISIIIISYQSSLTTKLKDKLKRLARFS